MTLRDKRQAEFAQKWIDDGGFGILYLCPRFGKIYTAINALETYGSEIKLLIAYPDKEIEKSWKEDFKTRGYKNPNVTYTTHLSMYKYEEKKYDLVIIDEIHLLSEAQLESAKLMLMHNRTVMGLTGTMTKDTQKNLKKELGLGVTARYPIELAIEEGVIVDYQITVFKVPLDNNKIGMFKQPLRTEKKQFSALSWVINKQQAEGADTMFMRLARMRIIQNSEAKRLKTIEILEKNKSLRALVFCGTMKIADNLGIPSFHTKTKAKDKDVFKNFVEGGGENHLAVIKIGNSGVTYKPLNFVLINYFDSNAQNFAQKINRCMGMEYNTPDKKAHIYVICSTEPTELAWLKKALEFFDNNKVKYV
jgi:superfamily II DNA or RNA helicase